MIIIRRCNMFARFTKSRPLYTYLYNRVRFSIPPIHVSTTKIILEHCNGSVIHMLSRRTCRHQIHSHAVSLLRVSMTRGSGFELPCRGRGGTREREGRGKGEEAGDRYDGMERQDNFPGTRAFLFVHLRLYLLLICQLHNH